MVGERATPYAFPFMTDDHICQLFIMIGAVSLFAGAPYKDELFPSLVARSGKTCMVFGNALGTMIVAVCYISYLAVLTLVPLMGQLTLSVKWGKIWTTLGAYQTNYSFGQVIAIGSGRSVQFKN